MQSFLVVEAPGLWSFLLGALLMIVGIVVPLAIAVLKNKKGVFKTS